VACLGVKKGRNAPILTYAAQATDVGCKAFRERPYA